MHYRSWTSWLLVGIASGASVACGAGEGTSSSREAVGGPTVLTPSVRRLFGQPNIHEGSINRVVPNRGLHIAGVHVDRSRTPNAIYVADSGNNRVLAFRSFGHCSNQRFRECTLDSDCRAGGTCQNDPTQNASAVFGQPSLTDHGACNGDVSGQGTATRRTLCLLGPDLITPAESSIPIAMATDRTGNLYIPDVWNNRVLEYRNPLSNQSADRVIGQTSFGANACNKGQPAPSADTLCLQPGGLDHAGGSVDIDAQGNLWVADLVNSRVLRFPAGGSTANLVLGQSDFTSNTVTCDTPRAANVMCRPVDVRVKSTGEVYVVDQFPAGDIRLDNGQSRVLVFAPPFTNGMAATRTMSFPVSPSLSMARLRNLTFDPGGVGDVWISDLFKLVLFDVSGNPVTVIGKPDFSTTGFSQDFFIPGLPLHPAYDPKQTYGGVGVDNAGNLYIAGETAVPNLSNEVIRFPTPVPTSFPPVGSSPGVHMPNGSLLTSGWNEITGRTVRDDLGMTAIGRQMFLGDHARILVFNNYKTAGAFPNASFVLGCSVFGDCPNSFYAARDGVRHLSRDAANRLWVAAGRWIQVFMTPITANNPAPLLNLKMSGCDAGDVGPCLDVHWADDASAVNAFVSSVVYDSVHDVLWAADDARRVMRISTPLTNPQVDLVIGQPDKASAACNMGIDPATASSLCEPSYVALDNFGNLYVVDSGYEGGGNRRLLEYDAASVLPVPGNLFPLPAASRVYASGGFNFSFSALPFCDQSSSPCVPVAVSFDQRNRMLLSMDADSNDQLKRLWIYNDPLGTQTPDIVVNFPFGQGAPTLVDGTDLLAQDHTWNRVMDFRYTLP